MKKSFSMLFLRMSTSLTYLVFPFIALQGYSKTVHYEKKYLIAAKTKQHFDSLTRIEVNKQNSANILIKVNGRLIPSSKVKSAFVHLDSLNALMKNKNNFNCTAGRFSLSVFDSNEKSKTLFNCIESKEYGTALKTEKELKDLAGII